MSDIDRFMEFFKKMGVGGFGPIVKDSEYDKKWYKRIAEEKKNEDVLKIYKIISVSQANFTFDKEGNYLGTLSDETMSFEGKIDKDERN